MANEWSHTFVRKDLNINYDTNNVGCKKLANHITPLSKPIDFLDLFLDERFWQNLSELTDLRADQTKTNKADSYYTKQYYPLA